MTEQERAFEAKWAEHEGMKDSWIRTSARYWHAEGWKRERAKAKPFIYELVVPTPGEMHLGDWVERNKIPSGTKLRVTVEELPAPGPEKEE